MTLCASRRWLIVILPFVFFLNMAYVKASDSTVPRIINGFEADAGEHDYFVTLLAKDQWVNGYHYWAFCGGTHIGNGTILTAANCFNASVGSDSLYVLIGNNSADMSDEYCLKDGNSGDDDYCKTVDVGETNNDSAYSDSGYVIYSGDEARLYSVTVDDFVVHQDYSRSSFRNDIALLQLDSAPGNSALILPSSDQYKTLATSAVADSVMIIGHGDIISDDDSLTFDGSRQLLEATLTPKTDLFCASASSDLFVGETMVCAGETGTTIQDGCYGDSGGPLFDPTTNILLGIVSFGPSKCGDPSEPYGVYTDVYQYVNWIESGGKVSSGGAFGFLGLILLPLMFFRKLK